MNNPEDPFRPAKLLVEGASSDIHEFERKCTTFTNKCNIEMFTDNESHPTETIHKVRRIGNVPDELERGAIHLIGDLRSALDKATHAASVLVGSQEPKYALFPCGDSEAHFLGQLKAGHGPYRGVPTELHDYFIKLRPWHGGNDLLRSFIALSNPTKHQSILTVDVNFNGIGVGAGNFYFVVIGTVWNESKTEAEIFRTLKCRPISGKVSVRRTIAFKDAATLTDYPFVRTISQIAAIVRGIVTGLEAETERVLRART